MSTSRIGSQKKVQTTPLDTKLILDAIDSLKQRKSRPDKMSIVKTLERRGFCRNDILNVLSDSVNQGDVVKVKYKESISYRNAYNHKTVQKYGDTQFPATASKLTITRILMAIKRLTKKSYHKDSGVSVSQILAHLHSRKELVKYDENLLKRTLEGQVLSGSIIMLTNGKYLVHKRKPKKVGSRCGSEPNASSDENGDEGSIGIPDSQVVDLVPNIIRKNLKKKGFFDVNGSENAEHLEKETSTVRGRPLSKRKKIKKSLGPDFLDPSDLGYQYLRDTFEPKCGICRESIKNNGNSRIDDSKQCALCGYTAHLNCLKENSQFKSHAAKSTMFNTNTEWHCSKCRKPCIVCKKPTLDSVLVCDVCQGTFHAKCVEMSPLKQALVSWKCNNCVIAEEKDEYSNTDTENAVQEDSEDESTIEEAMLSTQLEESMSSNDLKSDSGLDLFVHPEGNGTSAELEIKKLGSRPLSWSVTDVEHFIKTIGFSDQAQYFKDQEIDGKSLMLMRRVDVLRGMSLKLGPALKIYAHIQFLQGYKSIDD